VRANSGTVFVKEPLDYETRRTYSLVLEVTDGKHLATTMITINVTDVNDNAPVFEKQEYGITLVEEQTDIPLEILRVRAFDRDSDETPVIYRLEGQGTPEFFRVDNHTGIIQVVNRLDRDAPNGAPVWKFIVQVRGSRKHSVIRICRLSTTTARAWSAMRTSSSL
jgi:hypothetical protein